MRRILSVLTAVAAMWMPAAAEKGGNAFLGRWDITVKTASVTYPDWLEVSESGGEIRALIQPRSGSARPATDVKVKGNHLTLTRMPANSDGAAITWDLTLSGDRFQGTEKRGDAVTGRLEGVRAPALARAMPKAWSDPEPLFNGKDLSGWEPTNPATNHWMVKDGELVNESKGSNLKSSRKFDDFKLHIEFNCPDHGNSGIYLRGRYEVQVEYEPTDANDKFHSIGAIYSFVSPAVDLPRTPGKWETFDITLVGRRVTIIRNGVKTVDNQEIPGPTGGALDSHEAEPGPIYIQGDHTGGMKYRNITISAPKK